jgi:hypothetical protein
MEEDRMKVFLSQNRALLCWFGIHSWMYQRGDSGNSPNRMCRRCDKSQTWRKGRWVVR